MHRFLVHATLFAVMSGCASQGGVVRQSPPADQEAPSVTPSSNPASSPAPTPVPPTARASSAPAASEPAVYVPPPMPPEPPGPIPWFRFDVEGPPPPPPPPPAMPVGVPVQYGYQPCWEDTRVVLYREYFACEAPTYLYVSWAQVELGYSDDEMFALLWIARLRVLALADVVAEYGLQGQDLSLLCVQYGISMSAWYFEVEEGCDMSSSYRPLYLAYWSGRPTSIRYRNADLIRLLHLRMACEYYGMKPHEYLKVESSGAGFHWQAQANCHRAGSTGVDCRHDKIAAPGERPWACRDYNEWIQHQDAWARDQQIRNSLHEREISPRELEVGRTRMDAECRSRESKMRADEARRLEAEAAAAASRPEHDRRVAEYESRRAAQTRERVQAQRDLIQYERQMAEYDRQKADYETRKEEWRRRSQDNERRMSEPDRRAAAARRRDDEAKQEEAEAAWKVREAAAAKPQGEEPQRRQPQAEQGRRPTEEQDAKPRISPEVQEARRRQYEQEQIDRRLKTAQQNARHEEELKAAGPAPESQPQRYPGLKAGFVPPKPTVVDAQAGTPADQRSGEHHEGSEPRTEREAGPHGESRAVERASGSRAPEPERRPAGAKEPERREPPAAQKPPPPPPPKAPPPSPPPPRQDSSKSSDKDKDKDKK